MRTAFNAGLLLTLLAATAVRTEAQKSPIQKGSIQIGGTADISHTEPAGGGSTLTIAEAFPRAGYFVARGLAVSLNGRFRKTWADDQPNARNQGSTEWGVGPGISYYVSTRSPRLYPFISARALYNKSSSHAELIPSGTKVESGVTTRVWLGSLGALFMLADHVGLTSEAFYQRNDNTARISPSTEASSKSNTYGLQWGITAFIY